MITSPPASSKAKAPSFSELFIPKLITVLREGYGPAQLRADAIAGLTVAIVALPLSMAIAIASGATPEQGIYTAIVGGFIVSALGGSRFQIGGPAGAFIVLVASTVSAHGIDGLIIATILSGVLLLGMGFLRLGTYIKFIPYPVTVGFTAGIATIIFASQIKELFGLSFAGVEPGPLLEKFPFLWDHMSTVDPTTVTTSVLTIAAILVIRRLRQRWPAMLIAVTAVSIGAALLKLPVETIGTRFGGIPSHFPLPSLPDFTVAKVYALLPSAVSFALLGSIESLLSAVVADGMTGRRHRSNCELVAQGFANIASAMFGGICVTGTIARTATNVRAGAHGPVSGMFHAVFLLLFVLVAAPLASFVPLASLAGVLAVVAWNMIEKHAFAMLLRASRGDAAVLVATFFLTLFRDLTEAIVVGFALGSVLFIHRMSRTTAVATHIPLVTEDQPDNQNRRPPTADPEIVVYRISGAFFFGAAASIGAVLDQIADTHKALIVDFAAVPFVDATAANTLESMARKAGRRGVNVVLTGATSDVRKDLLAHGIRPPLVQYEASVETALETVRRARARVLS